MDDCVVCLEPTGTKTKCHHFLCTDCQSQLTKQECPYCRQPLKIVHEIKISFYDFVFLFREFYKTNTVFCQLLAGIDVHSLISTDELFYQPQIDDFYDKGITIQYCYDSKPRKNGFFSTFTTLEIYTPGVDVEGTVHTYRFSSITKHGQILRNYLTPLG